MWKIITTTFCLIFLAELGDKTQLATLLMATKSKHFWPVFIGSSLALVLSTFLGVFAGRFLSKTVPEEILHTAAGLGFVVIGLLLLLGKI